MVTPTARSWADCCRMGERALERRAVRILGCAETVTLTDLVTRLHHQHGLLKVDGTSMLFFIEVPPF